MVRTAGRTQADVEEHADTPFANWLAKAMAEHNIATLRQLAIYSGVGRSSLSTYARGEALPNTRTIKKLAKYFDVDSAVVIDLVMRSSPDQPAARRVSESPEESEFQGFDFSRIPPEKRPMARQLLEAALRGFELEQSPRRR